jgi:hypothetical protein
VAEALLRLLERGPLLEYWITASRAAWAIQKVSTDSGTAK